MPAPQTFRDAESYYATLAYECCHWTKHPSRLDREFGRKRWGDEGYAMEELVAELGTAFVCADLALTPEVREDHASYIASWLKVLSVTSPCSWGYWTSARTTGSLFLVEGPLSGRNFARCGSIVVAAGNWCSGAFARPRDVALKMEPVVVACISTQAARMSRIPFQAGVCKAIAQARLLAMPTPCPGG
jgi:hypothetical protein